MSNGDIGSGIGGAAGAIFGPQGAAVGSQIGGFIGNMFGSSGMSDRKSAALAYEYQQRLNQNAISDRVADARRAGVHPLFALGANVNPGSVHVAGGSQRDSWTDQGQDLSRSIAAMLPQAERTDAKVANQLQLENMGLQNDLLRSQIARERSQLGPGMPGGPKLVPGQGDAREELLPAEVIHSRHGAPHTTAGRAMPATSAFVNQDGTVSIWPSKDAKASIEDSLYEYEHMYRNRILPSLADKFYKYVYSPASRVFNPDNRARRSRQYFK